MSLEAHDLKIDLIQFGDQLKIKQEGNKKYIWDPVRLKYFVLFQEEFVRQLLILYLTEKLNWSTKLIAVEKQIKLGTLAKRYDLLLHRSPNEASILVECKSSSTKINQATFDQISNYNLKLNIPYLIITNGINTFACHIDFDKKKYTFIDHIPTPEQLNHE